MSTAHPTVEPVFTEHHAALVDHDARVGVGLAVGPLQVDPVEWLRSRRDLDVELRVLGYAVVALLEHGRFLVGSAPDDPWDLWGPDEPPFYAAGAAGVEWHPALAGLWSRLLEG
ncbi:hypothetical protein ACT3SQ_08830 [Brachybacterium sp. AOP42-C2-15]|uniref:hypothetical protein n=1 Tax=Brachybacterium sp. AOP42-C2-15 TaxID=3457670 RepID=UPI004033BD72